MKHIAFLFTLSLFTVTFSFCQTDTVFNQTDALGLKQGHWKKYFPNGNLMYQGFFKDNVPTGIMKRYYESGGLQAIMNFSDNGEKARAQLFYNDGERSAEGTYRKMQKDSTWKYYSFYTGAIVSEENFVNGKKEGLQKSFYANGQISEEIEYKNDIKEGAWNQYFEDGKPKLTASYRWNRVNGRYTFYYPTGIIMMLGIFDENKKDGPWIYYNEEGEEKYRINYILGKIDAEDEKRIIQEDEEYFKMIEENIGKFEDPSIEDFFQGPF